MNKLKNNLTEELVRCTETLSWTESRGRRNSALALTLALICFVLLPTAYAGSPTLGPWLGENLGSGNSAAENVKALISLTTGVNNTGTGVQSLLNNTNGSNNTATGYQSLFNNISGASNTANGIYSLFSNTVGWQNTATGASALQSNTDGSDNTATGASALKDNSSGNYNTATGVSALQSNTTGSCNTSSGYLALSTNTAGPFNTATGYQALLSNTSGSANTATGVSALGLNVTASHNTATGFEALGYNTAASNTAFGSRALHVNTTGSENTAVGYEALSESSTGVRNIAVGKWAGKGVSTASDVICIGAQGENADNSCYIGQIFNRTVSGGTVVFINSAGKLGTVTSSRRFKEDIQPMSHASETLFGLKPVTFRYKKEIDPQGIPQFGLIAEEVEKVNPDLVVRDKEGKVNTVRYEQINAMLLNEFLKEHKTVEQQQATIGQLKSKTANQEQTITALRKEMGVLTAELKEQAAQIQKVSAQLATNRPVPRLATNR